MALPEGFSPWEHLQDVLRVYHNKLVREEFADITDDDELAIPRGALKRACLLDDADTCDMTILRLFLFFFHARKAADLQAPIYGMPITEVDSVVEYHPTVTLYFSEDGDQVMPDKAPVRAEISFRLMDETSATMNEAKARVLATKIRTEFATSNGYRWRKGKIVVTYYDVAHGYRFQIYAYSETEAREVIQKVLGIRNHAYNQDYLRVHESRASFPSNPGNHFVYGKSRPKPVLRPTTYVRFQRATLAMWGVSKAETLVDLTGWRRGLVAA
jgi:hypothetical protein